MLNSSSKCKEQVQYLVASFFTINKQYSEVMKLVPSGPTI